MNKENTKVLLIAQMKRAIELLESESATKRLVPYPSWDGKSTYTKYNPELPELANKLHEIRRDSIRFIKEVYEQK